ncbi:GNAT family N-acetyltransferase [Candidatus Woesearchaeota archaeon]|nr:GNAT family N-acetyltransferase [Candidatus Woesearchaeota archaeon]
MRIRRFRRQDAEAVSHIIKECYLKLNIGGHTKKGLKLQIDWNSPENLVKRAKKIKYYVALENNKIVGICGYDNKKVHTLFVDIKYQKKGFGRRLLSRVLNQAREEGLKSIKCWSTFYAEEFYRSFGFVRRKEINSPKDIRLVEMKKTF